MVLAGVQRHCLGKQLPPLPDRGALTMQCVQCGVRIPLVSQDDWVKKVCDHCQQISGTLIDDRSAATLCDTDPIVFSDIAWQP